MELRVHRASRSVPAWCLTKGHVESGGRPAIAKICGKAKRKGEPLAEQVEKAGPVIERQIPAAAASLLAASADTVQIVLSGHVQGVGFRCTLLRAATQLNCESFSVIS